MTESQSSSLVRSRPAGIYYGWVELGIAAAAMLGTLPGRTQGLGLITEPLMRDVGIDRVQYAQLNLVATLAGTIFCLGVGSLMDRRGSRVVLTAIALLLGVVVLAMSIGFMLAFPLVGAVVSASGWRTAWAGIGMTLIFGLAPLAWFCDRSWPEAIGLEVDGGWQDVEPRAADRQSTPLARALRTPAFWVVALASAAYGLIASGIGLFNESILTERGFPPTVFYNALAVTAITGLAGNFAAGWFADRGSLRHVLLAALAVLSLGLVALAHVTTVTHVMLQAVAMGIGGGFVMVVFFSFWGRAYGPAELGRIQGGAQALTVLASAVGPLLMALCVEWTGSYRTAFYLLAVAVALLGAITLVVPMPPGAEPPATPAGQRR